MPHIIIEHNKTTNKQIDLSHLAKEVHSTLAAQETVSLESIKTRTIEIENVIVADGSHNQMVHIEIRLLSGRSEELKEKMAKAVHEKANNILSDINCILTINISELGTYIK